MRRSRAIGLWGTLSLAVLSLWFFAPGYWSELGFPLDDSWIHAVYGRELARSGTLAYNPGIAAAGETSPLWAIVWSLPHLVSHDPALVTLLIKAIGFGLHVLTVLLAVRIADRLSAEPLMGTVSGVLIALHPDLLAAAVSGMELPLATALVLWTTLETLRGPSWRLAAACFLAPLGRPEVACIAAFMVGGQLLTDGRDVIWRRSLRNARGAAFWRLALVAGCSILASFAVVAIRNVLATGRPMPTTFYAKAGLGDLSPWFVQWTGFGRLLERVALAHVFLLLPMTLVALWLLLRPARDLDEQAAALVPDASEAGAATARIASIFLTGIAFFVVSFALTPPIGVAAFYFQRYSLPGLPLVLLTLPLLLDVVLRAAPRTRRPLLRIAVTVALAVGLLAPLPSRLWRLANDARNIDDVQVAEGRALAHAASHHTVWAVDAGAIRYFGNAFVVDTVGLNTPEMLTPAWRDYLARHAPHYFSIVGGWSALDSQSTGLMAAQTFQPTTIYTVTSFQPQAVHVLKRCMEAPHKGVYAVFDRRVDFQCAAW